MNYFDHIIKQISQSVQSLQDEQFEKLVVHSQRVLREGHKIVVTGLGKNVPVCEKFVGTMNSLGMNAVYMNTNSAAHGDIGIVKEPDLVIVLTKSGETIESIYLTSLLKKIGCELWLLSFAQKSALTREIPNHILLELEHEGDLWDVVPNNSTTVNLIILQGLAITLAERQGITLQDFKKNHPGGHIGEQLKNV